MQSQIPKVTHSPQFDLKTHVRDGKGKITHENHYILNVVNHVQEFERPPGSGYIYDSSGKLIRSPDESTKATMTQAKPLKEVDTDKLLAQIADLKSQLNEKDKINIEEPHLEGKEVDLSEEIALMKQAGVDPTAIEATIKPFVKPNYLKK